MDASKDGTKHLYIDRWPRVEEIMFDRKRKISLHQRCERIEEREEGWIDEQTRLPEIPSFPVWSSCKKMALLQPKMTIQKEPMDREMNGWMDRGIWQLMSSLLLVCVFVCHQQRQPIITESRYLPSMPASTCSFSR